MGNAPVDRFSGVRPWLTRLATTLAAWLAAFLLVMALFALVGHELESWPLAVRALAVSGVLVVLMLNLVMPVLGPTIARWLAPAGAPSMTAATPQPTATRGAAGEHLAYPRTGATIDLPAAKRERLHALSVPVRPLGYVVTDHEDPAAAPAQAAHSPHEVGRVVVFDEYAEGLGGVEALSHAWLILWLDRAPATAPLQVVPRPRRATGERRGVFATRAPARPNRLGLSLVRVLGREGNVIRFAGVDLAHGTPVIDIKPYEPRVDTPCPVPRD